MGRMAIIDELLGILFLSNIPGNQCCKLDPFVFGIQLAERKIIVIQRHLTDILLAEFRKNPGNV